jgi:hypothetical protein
VAITGPAQGPPSIDEIKECTPCKVVVRLWKSDSNAIINKLFEKWETGLVAWNRVFYFKEANAEVVILLVNCGASAHDTAPSLLQKGATELEDITAILARAYMRKSPGMH